MVKLLNRAKMTISSTGTGNITLAAAVANFQTFAQAGASDGDVVRYAIEDNNGAAWEIGTAVMSSSATVMARTVTQSSSGGSAINLTSNAVVFGTLAAEDFADNAAPGFYYNLPSSLSLTVGGVSTLDGSAIDADGGYPIEYSWDAYLGSNTYGPGNLPPQLTNVSINQNTGLYSLTASSSASGAGTVNFRIKASDGVRVATQKVAAQLTFIPQSGLTGLYDMKDVNSYSGSGTTWSDVSGNSGPALTIDLSKVTYNSSGTGGIPSLSLDTDTGTPAVKVGPSYPTGLTDTNSPYDSTVVMIYAKPSSPAQSWIYIFASSTSEGAALRGYGSTSSALKTGSSLSGSWQHNAASSSSKLYIDKVDQTSITEQGLLDALGDSTNADKYHSIVLTNGHFRDGFATSYVNNNLNFACLKGELRALVFYNRALAQSELTGLHAHFSSDYSASEMVQ